MSPRIHSLVNENNTYVSLAILATIMASVWVLATQLQEIKGQLLQIPTLINKTEILQNRVAELEKQQAWLNSVYKMEFK